MKSILMISCAGFLLASCKEDAKAPDSSDIDLNNDFALRGHLDVFALPGGGRVPKNQAAYVVTTLEYEDGKHVGALAVKFFEMAETAQVELVRKQNEPRRSGS